MVIVFLTGLTIFIYPNISNIVSTYYQARIVWDYKKQQREISELEKKRELQELQQYNESLERGEVAYEDPFEEEGAVEAATQPLTAEEALERQLGTPLGHISIPKIGIDIPIYQGTSERVLQRAVGLLEGSSMPVGGEGTHTTLTGHRGLPSAKLFTDLPELALGDVFYINSVAGTLAYEVESIETVLPYETDSLRIVEGRDLVTLITCTPYMINTHRLLVTGTRIPYEGEPEPLSVPNQIIQYAAEKEDSLWGYLLAAGLLIALPGVGFLIWKNRRKGGEEA